VKLGARELKSPLFLVAGVRTAAPESISRIAAEVEALGGITTSSIGLVPRQGYREPVLAEYEPGCFVNAVGLANPGVREFREGIEAVTPLPRGTFLLVSLFADGSQGEFTWEFAELARQLESAADGFELNLSCPHISSGGALLGRNPKNIVGAVEAVRSVTDKPVFVKLSANFGNIGDLAAAAELAGATGASAINTAGPGLAMMPGMALPILSHGVGGLSGRGIRPIGLASVREVARRIRGPVIGMGGIETAEDLRAYRAAGASLFGIGSALAGMPLSRVRTYLSRLLADFRAGRFSAQVAGRTTAVMNYRRFRIATIDKTAPSVARITFDQTLDCEPGQFVMLWLPEDGRGAEKPYSVAWDDPLTVAVKAVGPFSKHLLALGPGDSAWVRGPYGQTIPRLPAANVILVAGGTGAAPLVFYHLWYGPENAAADVRHLLVIGAKTRQEHIFAHDLFNAGHGHDLSIATDDGTLGFHGTALEALANELNRDPTWLHDAHVIFSCPEKMMSAGLDLIKLSVPPDRVFVILEPYMKCCVGVCGSCALEDGRSACVDGHILSMTEVARFSQFGIARRGSSGGYEPL